MIPRAIQSDVFCIGYFKPLFSDATNSAGLGELSIAFLRDDKPRGGFDQDQVLRRDKISKWLLMIVTLFDDA
jgi:hypothetical protein